MTENHFLTREAILNALDLPTETVFVEEWGGTVVVRGLTAAEYRAFELSISDEEGRQFDRERFWLALVVRSLVDQDGRPLFRPGDEEVLQQKASSAMRKVFDVAARLNGIAGEEVEQLTKNSDSPGADSASA